tara:strand:+ start:858 stop:1274 length:417 start_codon:yes stop_codon:yes gene_type:complete
MRCNGFALLILERIGPADRLFKRIEFVRTRANITKVTNPVLNRAKRCGIALIETAVAGIARVEVLTGVLGEREHFRIECAGRLIEPITLLDGGTFLLVRVQCEDHRRSGYERQEDGCSISPVRDDGEPHSAELTPNWT